ncbi:MAG: hypothetical protein ABJX82_10435 [Paracoccaceae bacterium]
MNGNAIFTNNSASVDGGEQGLPSFIVQDLVPAPTTTVLLLEQQRRGKWRFKANKAWHGICVLSAFLRLTGPVVALNVLRVANIPELEISAGRSITSAIYNSRHHTTGTHE